MPARRLALLALALIMLALGGSIGAGVWRGGWEPAPALALDLEGGTQVILQASSRDGSPIDPEAMEQARQIMSQRINAMGVAETEITVQGGTNIVVDVPGALDQETSEALRQTASLSFRPLLAAMPPEGSSASDAGGAEGEAGTEESTGQTDPSQSTFDGMVDQNPDSAPATNDGSAAPWSIEQVTPEVQQELMEADCTDPRAQQEAAGQTPAGDPLVVCDPEGTQKYLLGPEVVPGAAIEDASVGSDVTPTGQPTGYYVVNMQFTDEYAQAFSDMTYALYGGEGATDAFGIVLDGLMISAPSVEEPSPSGEASISGQFSQEEASLLADQLNFGALPLEFEVQSEQQISATLGSDQLTNGLIAGLIGLALVIVYAALQYRVLAIVTTASLAVMGLLAYGSLTVLSNIPEIGYRLSLAGVVGLIVAIAFTADSFIVYFERVRDEIREGRGVVSAVDHGWDRAKRTIIASDCVNLIASVVLYMLATGGVRGFAFTLGLATILDLVVVFLFTHPVLQSLVRTNFFGKGHPASGLDPAALGRSVPAYAGRGRIRTIEERGPRGRGREEPAGRETLAERKARSAREAALGDAPPDPAGRDRRTTSDAGASAGGAGEER